MTKKHKSESAKADPEGVENTDDIDHLPIDDKNLTHECNVLYNILNPMKRTKSRIVITNQYYRVVWTPVVESQSLDIFELYWTLEAVQQLW